MEKNDRSGDTQTVSHGDAQTQSRRRCTFTDTMDLNTTSFASGARPFLEDASSDDDKVDDGTMCFVCLSYCVSLYDVSGVISL